MLLGRHRLLAELGHGGMADVYLACLNGPGGFQKLSVIKIARLSDEPGFVQMFLDEARLAARLSHPNVVQTYEVGEENGRQYMVMEYLDGPPLQLLLKRALKSGTFNLRMIVEILCHALEGLHYAHTLADYDGQPLRVVHRDLTPHNLIVTVQGVTKVLDFGIAKAADSRTVTQTGFYRGKLNYMAPEQARGEAVDARADIFSVGVVLAEAIRRQPFWGETTGPMISAKLLSGDIPDIRQAKIDPQLEDICARALVADRNARLRTAAELKQRLDWYLNATGGHISQSQVAAYVTPLFVDDRARIRTAIEAAFKNPTATPGASFVLPKLDASGATPGPGALRAVVTPRTPFEQTPEEIEVESVTAPFQGTSAPPTLRWTPYRAIAIGAVAAVAVVLVGLGLTWSPESTRPAKPEPTPVATPHAAPAPAPPSPAAAIEPPPSAIEHPAAPEPPPVAAPLIKKEAPAVHKERRTGKPTRSPEAPPAGPSAQPAPAPVVDDPWAAPAPPARKAGGTERRTLDTDVFEDKKREIDRDPWKK